MRADRGFLRRAALRRVILTAATGLLLGVTLPAFGQSPADEAEPALPEILQQLDRWRESFASIRVVWHEWCREHTLEGHPGLDAHIELDGMYYTRFEFVWADWGAFRVETVSHEAGRPVYRSLEGTDGVRPWSCRTKHGEVHGKDIDIEKWEMLRFWRPERDRPLAWNVVFGAVYGLWNNSGSWVNEYLARGEDVALQEWEDVDGHRCAVVTMVTDLKKSRPSIPNETYVKEETYWLDAQHGFVPRKCRVMGSTVGEEGLHHRFTWTVAEFRKVDDRLWFPRAGNMLVGAMDKDPADVEWVVKEVTLNESLGRAFFQAPKPSAGTTVIDYVNMEGYRAGGRSDPGQAGGQATPPTPAPPTGAVRALPWSFPWKWMGLAAAVPKQGADCYGDVMCGPDPNQQCTEGENDCGWVYRCPGAACVDLCIQNPCYPFYNKPRCTGTWGQCVWP